MTTIPQDAPRSEDGQWWWDGSSWQPTVDNWPLLSLAVTEQAHNRLHDLSERVIEAVTTFHADATTQIESEIKGRTEDTLLDGLFGAVVSVLIAAVPGGEEVALAKEAVKAFIDVMKKGADDYANKAAQDRVDDAKEQMRHRVDDLLADTLQHTNLAQAAAEQALPQSLESFIAANPGYRHTRPEDAQAVAPTVCDQIGILDVWPGPEITEQLWTTFHKDFYRATARLHFFNMDNDSERLIFLLNEVEPVSDVEEFLHVVGADVDYWMRRIRLYHQRCPDAQSAEPMEVFSVLEYAEMTTDG